MARFGATARIDAISVGYDRDHYDHSFQTWVAQCLVRRRGGSAFSCRAYLRRLAGTGRLRRGAIFLDDLIVDDDDGAVVIPAAIVEEVRDACLEQERLEAWLMSEADKGVPLPGLYPPNAETRARYKKSRDR
ncbi:hypothetical protein LCGC14_0328800 [marine sediment metagenome]|uniref:Uncharacterized protein n=1 Tax=marine sediment metagenome TaxID=412755 RepID=A0A0F9TH57_9ZZZZ